MSARPLLIIAVTALPAAFTPLAAQEAQSSPLSGDRPAISTVAERSLELKIQAAGESYRQNLVLGSAGVATGATATAAQDLQRGEDGRAEPNRRNPQ